MTIVDFFDPNDIEHIKAYRHLELTGTWPEDFLPNSAEFFPGWQIAIEMKLASAYVNYMLVQESMNDIREGRVISAEAAEAELGLEE